MNVMVVVCVVSKAVCAFAILNNTHMAILKCVPPISYRQVFSRLYYLANECA